MPRKSLKRLLPDPKTLQEHRHLRHFGSLLRAPDVWHLSRRSAAGGVSVGLFFAFIPVPFQSVLAAGAALLLRVNLPLSIAFVWVTNPFTIPFLGYLAYKIGAWMLGIPPAPVRLDPGFFWLLEETGRVWKPVLLGSLFLGVTASAVGYIVVRVVWRLVVLYQWAARRARRGVMQE